MRSHAKAPSAFTIGRRASAPPALAALFVATFLALLALAPQAKALYLQEGSWQTSSQAGEVMRTKGIAVSPLDGSVYTAQHQLGLFTPQPVAKWTAGGDPGTPATFGPDNAQGVAVDPVTGNVYVFSTSGVSGSIAVFQPDGTPVGTPFPVDQTIASSDRPKLGVDAAGNVYFPNQVDKTIEKFSPTGALLQTFGPNPGGTPFNGPLDVAVDAAGNVYAADYASSANEVQSVLRGAGANVATGGTYKLSFEGQSTGATLTGNLVGGVATADVVRANGTATRTAESPELTGVTAAAGAYAVGMAITGTGIPAGTKITALGAGAITLSANATSSGATNNLVAGYLTNVTPGTATIALGANVDGAGIPSGATIAEIDGSTVRLSAPPSAAGAAVSLNVGSRTVTGLNVTSGSFLNGLTVSGAGIPPDATASSVNTGAGTFNLSATPSASGTGVAIAADLGFNASSGAVDTALEALSTIGADNVIVANTSGAAARVVTFSGALATTDVAALNCNGAGLTFPGAPPSPLCTVTETTKGGVFPGRVVKFSPGGAFDSDFLAGPELDVAAIDIDRSAGSVFVASRTYDPLVSGDYSVRKLNLAGVELDSFQPSPRFNSRNVSLAVNPATGRVYAKGEAQAGPVLQPVVSIWSQVPPPTAITDPEGTVTTTTAVLNGRVDNNDALGGSLCEFQVTLASDPGFASPLPALPCDIDLIEGDGEQAISATATGLDPATDYIYRVSALNAGGSADGDPEAFTTLALQRSFATTIVGSGTLSCAADGGDPEPCATSYPDGTELSVAATPNAGNTFSGFSEGSGSAAACSASPCAFTITANSSLKATFAAIPPPPSCETDPSLCPPPPPPPPGDGGGTPPPPPPPNNANACIAKANKAHKRATKAAAKRKGAKAKAKARKAANKRKQQQVKRCRARFR